ncbi:uncharacterized protein THITE_2114685 [Thermothielavioides terrestris NRRL 8126]|uniref:Transmembrane protein n=1 Tax=Thermothielavioides terrestris (strain ATCC 38088 / NRRL 8126) TaxID=578455 RepID=G2R146_THETT|nr:uncharacterized protein THITE_2114685 [Thermothielavioides terrestris NRRL 8126]AEO66543.1 hypothetical protein THITE_2114685 [Thermothielavioides terrestris NRRL 8126]
MSKQISVPIFVIAIVLSVFGSAAFSVLGAYLFMRRRRARRRGQEQEQVANQALDRAIVSYIAKEFPSQQAAQPLGRAMTTATDASAKDTEAGGPISSTLSDQEPPTTGVERSQPPCRTETSTADSSLRKTASSHFADSAEQVYGDIIARPLERTSIPPASPRPEFVAATRRDDVGWPLTKESWL